MNDKEKIKAVLSRDNNYDDKFIFGVKSTKIICKPSCPSKLPLEKNIVFFNYIDEAIHNGYRPCKICKPQENGGKENE